MKIHKHESEFRLGSPDLTKRRRVYREFLIFGFIPSQNIEFPLKKEVRMLAGESRNKYFPFRFFFSSQDRISLFLARAVGDNAQDLPNLQIF